MLQKKWNLVRVLSLVGWSDEVELSSSMVMEHAQLFHKELELKHEFKALISIQLYEISGSKVQESI